jgi:hypothetical protein
MKIASNFLPVAVVAACNKLVTLVLVVVAGVDTSTT